MILEDQPGLSGASRAPAIPAVGALVAALLAIASSGPAPAQAATKRALLVGVDDYQADSLRDLRGCGNDVELMKSILVGRFEFEPEQVLVLKDAEATRGAILSALRSHLIGPSVAGDVALLHYSGHGSQMLDNSGDEVDGMDETIVPHDSRTPGIFDINDDEINGLMGELSDRTPHAVFILDSCHSGSGARAALLGNTVRQIDPDLRPPPPPEPFAAGSREVTEGADDFRLPGSDYVLISGCRANELSNETQFEGRRHGALTYFLAGALRAAGDRVTYRDVMDQVKADVTARFRSQHPQLEGTGIDTVTFGVERVVPRPYVLVEPQAADPQQVTVGAGEIFGLRPGTLLAVFPPGSRDFADPAAATAQVSITGVEATTASGIVVSGSVAPRSRAVLDAIRPPDFAAGVSFEEGVDPNLERRLQEALIEHDSVRLEAARDEAHVRLRQAGDEIVLEGRDLERLAAVALSDPPSVGEVQRVVGAVLDWAKWFAILAIDNPGPQLGVELRIERAGAPAEEAAPETVAHGTQVSIAVKNTSSQDVHLVILDLTSRGIVKAIYPPAGIEEAIAPGQTKRLTVPATVPAGQESVVDWIKVIATADPIPASIFELAPVARSIPLETRDDESALESFLRRAVQGRTRDLGVGLAPVEVRGWATAQRVLRVARPQARAEGFAAHFDTPDEASRAAGALGGTRSVCGPDAAADCYEVAPFAGDPTMVEVRSPAQRSGDDALTSIGAAFEEAYALREDSGATRVEPLLGHQAPRAQTAPHPDDPAARGDGGHDPRAEGNTMWSLQYVRVPEAWSALRAAGRPAGAEAQGVVIAHPDTGYLQHPEIWVDAGGDGPLWPEKGYDYYGEDDDPSDDLVDTRLLDNPAHGTGSSSAIVSPAGCQLAGAQKCPTGGAPGARLVPLRVNRSVVQFDTKRLTRTILDASAPDGTRVKERSDLMAIAMGGVPSWALWKAVRKAEERGHLIIAAAGNYVKTVVWPARFDSTIAVAAVNAGCRPWSHSSLGPAVDFAAPGESVWRATLDKDGNMITGMGTGTTYATATTAGVAALWMASHQGSPEFEEIRREGRTTAVFRALVGQTAWEPNGPRQPASASCDPGTGWRPFFYGAGILDAAALLAAPLSDAAGARAVGAERVQDLPLWLSLYGAEPAPEVARGDYGRLFGVEPGADLEPVAVYEAEVTYHYALSETVAEAIERLLAGERGDEGYARVREALAAQDLSPSLRRALNVG